MSWAADPPSPHASDQPPWPSCADPARDPAPCAEHMPGSHSNPAKMRGPVLQGTRADNSSNPAGRPRRLATGPAARNGVSRKLPANGRTPLSSPHIQSAVLVAQIVVSRHQLDRPVVGVEC